MLRRTLVLFSAVFVAAAAAGSTATPFARASASSLGGGGGGAFGAFVASPPGGGGAAAARPGRRSVGRPLRPPIDSTQATTTTSSSALGRRLLPFRGRFGSSRRPSKRDPFDDGPSSPDRETRGEGSNWIERELNDDDGGGSSSGSPRGGVADYSLGISGKSFGTGPLSGRMYEALMGAAAKQFGPVETMDREVRDAYVLYAMDFTAKEATKAALSQNGLELATEGDDGEDEGMWGEIDAVRLVNDEGEVLDEERDVFETVQDVVDSGRWTPGDPFDFVVSGVPAKVKEMDITDFLKALDPDGTMREQAKGAGWSMPDEDIDTLKALSDDCQRRSNNSPRDEDGDGTVFGGGTGRGYRVMDRGDVLEDSKAVDGTENGAALMHVMDAFVSHGALIVDVTDGGTTYKSALALAEMWNAASDFWTALDSDPDAAKTVEGCPMDVAEGAGSTHAKVGYASYDEGSMQFLETRLRRSGESILPREGEDVLGPDNVRAMRDAFDVMCDVGKDVVRIATAASAVEADAFLPPNGGGGFVVGGNDEDMPTLSGLTLDEVDATGLGGAPGPAGDDERRDEPTKEERTAAAVRASEAATLMVNELLDDGKPLRSSPAAGNDGEGEVSMSPHRICRYVDKRKAEGGNEKDERTASFATREVFGAHTDTSFVTIVPVASVSGLEVYDEAAERWYRPELAAREHWEAERRRRKDRSDDDESFFETVANDDGEDVELPWHARYVVVVPGELLQLVTRNEVPAAVHRVVAAAGGGRSGAAMTTRLSAPALLRARNGSKMDVGRYLGRKDDDVQGGKLLRQCDGATMEDLHDALQPTRSFQ